MSVHKLPINRPSNRPILAKTGTSSKNCRKISRNRFWQMWFMFEPISQWRLQYFFITIAECPHNTLFAWSAAGKKWNVTQFHLPTAILFLSSIPEDRARQHILLIWPQTVRCRSTKRRLVRILVHTAYSLNVTPYPKRMFERLYLYYYNPCLPSQCTNLHSACQMNYSCNHCRFISRKGEKKNESRGESNDIVKTLIRIEMV